MLRLLGLAPPAASAHAAQLDALTTWFTVLLALLGGPVIVLIFFFAIRYRRGKEVNRAHPPNRKVALEVSWSVIPFLLILGFFIVAARMFYEIHEPPAGAMPISVVAKQWMWKFQHPEGQGEINMLHVPTGQPVRLTMTSQDVIHSLYIPALRLKQDLLPRRYTEMWFTATKPGTYPIRCAEFCGTDHAVMGGGLVAMRPDEYARWLSGQASGGSLATAGAELYRRLSCGACHDAGAAVAAPPLAGLYGSRVRLADGRSVVADDQYLHDAIVTPNTQAVAGYRTIMPTYGGVIGEDDVLKLVARIRELKNVPGGRQ
ncbi:MAG: cytochrome c oxidase subunit II [Novosphingobium sp.]|nr:cytochrome c oxidase subunit II [Novosphingobium sp.]